MRINSTQKNILSKKHWNDIWDESKQIYQFELKNKEQKPAIQAVIALPFFVACSAAPKKLLGCLMVQKCIDGMPNIVIQQSSVLGNPIKLEEAFARALEKQKSIKKLPAPISLDELTSIGKLNQITRTTKCLLNLW